MLSNRLRKHHLRIRIFTSLQSTYKILASPLLLKSHFWPKKNKVNNTMYSQTCTNKSTDTKASSDVTTLLTAI